MKNILYFIIFFTLISCKKDIEDGRVINGELNANTPEHWLLGTEFNGGAYATITNGDLFIIGSHEYSGPSSPYVEHRSITLQLKLEGNPIEKKTYLLFNDSAQYGKGIYSSYTSEGDAYSNHNYSTGYFPNSSQELRGSALITSIDNNRISGTFHFDVYQFNYIQNPWCCDSVGNGVFTDVLIKN